MAKVLKWGQGVGMFSTPICVTPQISAKLVYLSVEPLTNFSRKLEFELNGKALEKFIASLIALRTGNNKIFVEIREVVPDAVMKFLTDAKEANDTVYITVPLFNVPTKPITAKIFVNPPYTLVTTKYMFGSLYAGHFVTGVQIYDLLVEQCGCFTSIPVAFKLIIDGKHVVPCSLCKYRQGNNKFCYLFNSNYSCLFHAGDIPTLDTEIGNEQLASLMNTPDIDLDVEVDMDKIKEDMWRSSISEEVE